MSPSPRFDPRRLAAIGARLDADVAAGAIPGAAVLIGTGDTDRFAHVTGFRDATTRAPLGRDALWRIYSMTKPIVSVAAMILAERGMLRLDQPVADFIPAFARLRVALPEGGTVAAAGAPTVHDLLRHTAGLAYGFLGDSPAQRIYAADGFLMEDLSNAEFADRIAALPLEHQPGRVWHYSHATDVLGRVLEVAAAGALQSVLDATLFGPLGMRETLFRWPETARDRVAEPLPQAPGARPIFFDPCAPRRGQRGNHGLVSTIDDQARFLRMLLSGGLSADGNATAERVMGAHALALTTADHIGRDIAKASYYPPGPGYGFGLGVAVRLVAGEAPFPGSVGDYYWSGVGGTYFWVDPVRRFFAILMLQTASAEQRQHYRTLTRNLVYAALD